MATKQKARRGCRGKGRRKKSAVAHVPKGSLSVNPVPSDSTDTLTTVQNPFSCDPAEQLLAPNPRRRYRGRGLQRFKKVTGYAPKPEPAADIAEENPFLPSRITPRVSRKRIVEVEYGRNVLRKPNVCRQLF